jgi:Uma2 family endonuclease
MTVLITDPWLEDRLKAEREASGLDRFDEVWEGVYFMPPIGNNEHQSLNSRFGGVLLSVIEWPGLGTVYVGVNVSDREEGWEKNYRIPDVAVFLKGTKAKNCGTHWCGGPDFLAEILSPGDRAREKLPFYADLGVREVLLLNRDPWALELYQRRRNRLRLVGKDTLEKPALLASAVLPLRFHLLAGEPRPQIEITHTDGVQRWII